MDAAEQLEKIGGGSTQTFFSGKCLTQQKALRSKHWQGFLFWRHPGQDQERGAVAGYCVVAGYCEAG